jgi:hypothetical protein
LTGCGWSWSFYSCWSRHRERRKGVFWG